MAETVVTLAEAKAHLRVTQSLEDDLIGLYILAAQDYIGNYLNQSNFAFNHAVKAAALLIVADLYENREGAGEKDIKKNPAVENLLHPYRKCLGI